MDEAGGAGNGKQKAKDIEFGWGGLFLMSGIVLDAAGVRGGAVRQVQHRPRSGTQSHHPLRGE